MDRGSSVYQDLAYLFYFIITNAVIMTVLVGLIFVVMLQYGYKSVTIKFNKRNKSLKQTKHNEKLKETAYLSKLEKKIKKKKHK